VLISVSMLAKPKSLLFLLTPKILIRRNSPRKNLNAGLFPGSGSMASL